MVVVGGSKAGADMALCFSRAGYDNMKWVYRTPYLFWKYELMFHNRSLLNKLRGLTTLVALLWALLSKTIAGGILKPVDTAAVPSPQRQHHTAAPAAAMGHRALPLLLGSGTSPFEATRQPSSGPPKAADLRPNPLTQVSSGALDSPLRMASYTTTGTSSTVIAVGGSNHR